MLNPGNFFKRINSFTIFLVLLALIVGWQLGHYQYQLSLKNYKPDFKVINQTPPNSNSTVDFKLFWEVWNLVSQKYIDKGALDPQKLYYGAIQGMVAAIGDPYTVFLPPESQKTTKEQLSGAFDGIGIELGYNKDKRLTVIAPLKDTPAQKAGIKAGDLILKINNKDTLALTLPDAVNLIRGPKGTTVVLNIFSEGDSKPKDVSIVRDTITVKSVAFEQKETKVAQGSQDDGTRTTKSGKTVAYIRLTQFGEKTPQEWDSAVSEALSKAPVGVVVDVRNNPGGFLDGAVYVASEFLNDGPVVIQQDYQGQKTVLSVNRAGKLLKLPLVVLINKGSASASEIFAGAMQDRKRATIVGEQSFGKGTIQSAEDLPNGTGIHITTAKWLTPNERWIHTIGLTPDIVVTPGDKPDQDLQLEKALEILDK